jgi:hypothetical protein
VNIPARRDIDKDAVVAALAAEVVELREEVVAIRDRLDCPRCSTDPPPPARWPGDQWAADTRRPHTCGKSRWTP